MCTTLLLGVSGNFTNCSTWNILSSRCESFGVIAAVRPGNRRSLMVMEEALEAAALSRPVPRILG
jgi:hypothetical protein